MNLGAHPIGPGHPVYYIAEIGQNHGGSIALALEMMRLAKAAGASAVKFQKRVPALCIPAAEQRKPRELPGGQIVTYLQYRETLEFGREGYDAIAAEAKALDLAWSASAWDIPSLEFLLAYAPPFIKLPSAALTDLDLLRAASCTGIPVILSTGMSTLAEIDAAMVQVQAARDVVLLHCTSTYPAPASELNLRCIPMLAERYGVPVGFSDHSGGVWASLCAVVLGAAVIEAHFTSSRMLPGTDQAASLEPEGFSRIVRYGRRWAEAAGDGVKRVYSSERPVMARLRRVPGVEG